MHIGIKSAAKFKSMKLESSVVKGIVHLHYYPLFVNTHDAFFIRCNVNKKVFYCF